MPKNEERPKSQASLSIDDEKPIRDLSVGDRVKLEVTGIITSLDRMDIDDEHGDYKFNLRIDAQASSVSKVEPGSAEKPRPMEKAIEKTEKTEEGKEEK